MAPFLVALAHTLLIYWSLMNTPPICEACSDKPGDCLTPIGDGASNLCWRCAHLVTHHAMQIDAPLNGCTCNQSEIYPSAAIQHMDVLTKIALCMARDRAGAQDLVQETMLKAITHWLQYRPGTSVRGWLTTILQNTFINAYKRRRRHERFAVEHPIDVLNSMHGDADHSQINRTDMRELAPIVRHALAKLPEKYRAVLIRADIEGQKYREIAEELDMPMGTVMSVLFRARRALEAPMAEVAAEYGITVKRRVSR